MLKSLFKLFTFSKSQKEFDLKYNSQKTELQKNESIDKEIFIWCLIGNIIEKNIINGEIKFGTKHFSPNTKVYCFPVQWGDGYENIIVIGRHRKTKKLATIIIKSKYITNWRIKKVYNPKIIQLMNNKRGWTNSENDKEIILKMLNWLPERTKLNS
ncbi:hypothetical protein [Flavobacterium sp. H122]|uniref:hypothetical protein n=1 Tax=Flavobacterium sp. H122 TaxID=2529860 RepID=UPI0010A9C51B|nr:hypothetical protein [Flavobacterium sp. H122]